MNEPTPRILPTFDSPARPRWLVEAAEQAASASFADHRRAEWADKISYACDKMLALAVELPEKQRPNCHAKAHLRPAGALTDEQFSVSLAGELLGAMVGGLRFAYEHDELCRDAYPALWNLALDEGVHDPDYPEEPDPVLYDNSVPLSEACKDGPPWPAGIHRARHAVMEFANNCAAYSSHGLGLAHAVHVPVLWPPPQRTPALAHARRNLTYLLDHALVGQDEYTADLFEFLSSRDDPSLNNPTVARADQVAAAVREWDETVISAARGLAAATYEHAWQWVSADQDRWDLGVVAYARSETLVSVNHLKQATDTYDLADAACRSYAWWWCRDRNLDVSSLRNAASAW